MTVADYSPLTRPVPPEELKHFRQWARSSGWIDTARSPIPILQVVLLIVLGVLAFSFFASFFAFITSILFEGTAAAAVVSVLAPVLILVLGAGLAFAAWRHWTGTPATWEKRLRLREFAAARDSTYAGHLPSPRYPGMIFDIGTSRSAYDSVRANTGRPLEVANYRYTVKRGKSSTTYSWGFVALKLDRRLPHMVLDAVSNNLILGSNLPQSFGQDAALSLEGDFDRYFTLYVPPEYGRDALYVFTPDLMALLIDESSSFDVEIVDDWMFVYSTQPFDLLQPGVWERLDRIVETIGTKTLSQTRRYADERVGDRSLNVIAPQGRRMRRRVGPAAIAVGVCALLWLAVDLWRILS